MSFMNACSLLDRTNASISSFTNISYCNTCTLIDLMNASVHNVSTFVDSLVMDENYKNLNISDSLTIGSIENNNGNMFMLFNLSSNPIMR